MLPDATRCYSTLPDATRRTQLDSWRYTTLIDATWSLSPLRISMVLYMLIDATHIDGSRRYSTLPDSTRRYPTLPDATRRYPTLPDATRRYPTLPDATRRYPTLPDATGRYPTLPLNYLLKLMGKSIICKYFEKCGPEFEGMMVKIIFIWDIFMYSVDYR
jgi:hypothetical protein